MVVIRALVVYFVLLILLRVTTRRVSRSMTPLDMVILFLFGGLSAQAILGDDHSMTSAFLAVGTIAGAHILISVAKVRWPLVGMISEGTPVVVYDDDRWLEDKLRHLRIYKSDVLAEVRQQGLSNLENVRCVIVEPTGGISVVRK